MIILNQFVTNNIFAYIAVKYDFHKYFCCHSNELFLLIDKFVQTQKDKSSWSGFDECNLGDDDDEIFFAYFLVSVAVSVSVCAAVSLTKKIILI